MNQELMPHTDSRKKFASFGLVMGFIVGLVLVVLVSIILFRHVSKGPTPQPFHSPRWRQVVAYEGSTIRAAMLDDLIHKHGLRGMPQSQVDHLLGPGDKTGHWENWDRNYWLRNDLIDSQWLVLRFGPDQRVSEYAIVTD